VKFKEPAERFDSYFLAWPVGWSGMSRMFDYTWCKFCGWTCSIFSCHF